MAAAIFKELQLSNRDVQGKGRARGPPTNLSPRSERAARGSAAQPQTARLPSPRSRGSADRGINLEEPPKAAPITPRSARTPMNRLAPPTLPTLDFSYCDIVSLSQILDDSNPPRTGQVKTRSDTPVDGDLMAKAGLERPCNSSNNLSPVVSLHAVQFISNAFLHGPGKQQLADTTTNLRSDRQMVSFHRNQHQAEDLDDSETEKEYTRYDAHVVRLCNNEIEAVPDLITTLSRVVNIFTLVNIDLSCNSLKELPPASVWECFVALRVLFLHKNSLPTMEVLEALTTMKRLEHLTTHNNPLQSTVKHYRPTVLAKLPNLKKLDFVPVTRRDKPAHPELLLPPIYDR